MDMYLATAFSPAKGHVIVVVGGDAIHYDLREAEQLRTDLSRALKTLASWAPPPPPPGPVLDAEFVEGEAPPSGPPVKQPLARAERREVREHISLVGGFDYESSGPHLGLSREQATDLLRVLPAAITAARPCRALVKRQP